jgi:hypothetical protein
MAAREPVLMRQNSVKKVLQQLFLLLVPSLQHLMLELMTTLALRTKLPVNFKHLLCDPLRASIHRSLELRRHRLRHHLFCLDLMLSRRGLRTRPVLADVPGSLTRRPMVSPEEARNSLSSTTSTDALN